MKILLTAVNAKYIHSNPAVYSLRAYAGEKFREYLEIAEYTINHRLEDILSDLYHRNPEVITFSCYIWNWSMIRELLNEIPKILPNCPIWLGGPEVSFHGKDILNQYPQVTGIMIGEGEKTFQEIIEYYLKNGITYSLDQLSKISGLLLREKQTAEREITDMSTLPFLYDDMEPFENRILYYESSRGCPYRCSYCLSSIEKKVRFRDIYMVKKELQFFLDRRVPQVKFIDRTFNCNHDHAIAIWNYILEHDNGITNFHFEIAADILNQEELDLLKKMRPGLVQLEIGVQTVNPNTLEAVCRKTDMEKLKNVVESLRSGNNIHIHLDLIAGLPYEDYDSFQNSFDRVYEMQPEQLQLGFLKVLKGSAMEENAEEFGILYLSNPPYEVLKTNWLSYGEICRLKKIEEMVELYYNSNQFTHCLPLLVKNFNGPFQMFEKLADYYEENGYFINTPARSYRYQVFYQFAKKVNPEKEELYRELLTFDMYLRENLKSRPDFSREIGEYKDGIWDFYKKEEEERKVLLDYKEYDARQMFRMTHTEPFFYTVWKNPDDIQKTKEPSMILFDYKKRSPLTKEVETLLLELGDKNK